MQITTKYKNIITYFILILPVICWSQIVEPQAETPYYLFHSSGNAVVENTDGRAIIQAASGGNEQLLQFVSDGAGYYWIKPAGQKKYIALSGSWNTYFISDSTTDASKYAIEKVSGSFIRLKCKYNNKYMGTDYTTSGSNIYSDKSGTESMHYWYISTTVSEIPVDTAKYLINPNAGFSNTFEGWGVSLCWWANMCGKWSDDKIDEIVDWLVSSNGLNYNIFRYNIGGGDDPLNRNCTPHHMTNGKGLRAEMEGFKDSLNAAYNWIRDSAQRKIMLKIKEKRPDAIFEAFSNSPPYYMTYSGCCAGNTDSSLDNLKPEYYEAFAHYLVDVCKFYSDSFNIVFKTLEPFNEPVTNYWAANGGQEGCHFNTTSQIAFIKILAPILNESGLNTVISASDETSTTQSVTDFNAYLADIIALNLVKQWNTHTYSASNQSRANLRALSTNYNKTLWMSEVGSGGSGISGNLGLAQKLMDDIRFIRPEAWIDWQYIEEGNDQWCLVTGNFADQTYSKVKNYYVRQQISRYIKVGSGFLVVPNDQVLAALSPAKDTLIIVALNNSSMKSVHKIDLSLFKSINNSITSTRTSQSENNFSASDFALKDKFFSFSLPAYSISTFIIPVDAGTISSNELKTGIPYLILTRTANLMLKSDNSSIAINNYIHGDLTQLWKLSVSGDGYNISNYEGKKLTDNGSYYAVASEISENGQVFYLEDVGDGCYKILSSATGKSLDLEGEKNTSGTKAGFWEYGNSPAASHRQWLCVLPPSVDTTNITSVFFKQPSCSVESVKIFGSDGALIVMQSPENTGEISVYTITGIKTMQQSLNKSFTSISSHPGIYLVRYKGKKENYTNTKVIVR